MNTEQSNEKKLLLDKLLQVHTAATKLAMIYRAEDSPLKERYEKVAEAALRMAQLTKAGINTDQAIKVLLHENIISLSMYKKIIL